MFLISKNGSKYPINKTFLPHARVLRLAKRSSWNLSSTIPEDGVAPITGKGSLNQCNDQEFTRSTK